MKALANTCFVVLGYLALCGTANAQSGLERASTSPYEKQLIVEFTSGTTVVADYNTSRFYITSGNGEQYEVTFSDAVAYGEDDPAKRQQMLDTFRSSLTDPGHLVTIRAPRVATDTSHWPNVEWCGNVICIDPYSSSTASNTSYSTAGNPYYQCDFKCLPCDHGPCNPADWFDDKLFYTGFGAGWDEGEGGGTVTEQELLAYDKERWKSHQQGACEDAKVIGASTLSGVAATAGACAAIPAGGVSVLGCAAGVIGIGIGIYQLHEKEEECLSEYPGRGNW